MEEDLWWRRGWVLGTVWAPSLVESRAEVAIASLNSCIWGYCGFCCNCCCIICWCWNCCCCNCSCNCCCCVDTCCCCCWSKCKLCATRLAPLTRTVWFSIRTCTSLNRSETRCSNWLCFWMDVSTFSLSDKRALLISAMRVPTWIRKFAVFTSLWVVLSWKF